jgi:hypothetical protein
MPLPEVGEHHDQHGDVYESGENVADNVTGSLRSAFRFAEILHSMPLALAIAVTQSIVLNFPQ